MWNGLFWDLRILKPFFEIFSKYILLWKTTPVWGETIPLPNSSNKLWTQLTALPFLSTTTKVLVSPKFFLKSFKIFLKSLKLICFFLKKSETLGSKQYLSLIEKYPTQDIKDQIQNPVWHVHNGKPPKEKIVMPFSMLLNLVGSSNADNKIILWKFQFLQNSRYHFWIVQ